MDLNHIYFEDLFEGLQKIEDHGLGLVLTSPPFRDSDVGAGPNTDRHPIKNPDNGDAYYQWLDSFIEECLRVAPMAMIFNSPVRLHDILKRYDVKRTLIWYKAGSRQSYKFEPIFIFADSEINVTTARPMPYSNIWSDVLSIPPINDPTTPDRNPVRLYELLIRMVHGAHEKGVCDPCMGWGTTAQAAKVLGVPFLGFEVKEDRFNYSISQLGKVKQQEVLSLES